MRSRNTLQAVLEGTLIGAGVNTRASGGIMAVAFGVYQEALDAIIGLFSNFKELQLPVALRLGCCHRRIRLCLLR